MTGASQNKGVSGRRAELSVHLVGATEGILPDWFESEDGNSALDLLEYAGTLGLRSLLERDKDSARTRSRFIRARFASSSHVFQHVQVTFDIAGVSNSAARSMQTHRDLVIGLLRQPGFHLPDARFVAPPGLSAEVIAILEAAFVQQIAMVSRLVSDAYGERLGSRERRELYKALLPNMIETKMVVSGGLLNWIKFIEARDTPESDGELRALAREILRQLAERYPPIFDADGRALWDQLP